MKILITGLPGSGKTSLARKLAAELNCDWFNADAIRQQHNDWDFSESGRIRQATRMRDLANAATTDYVIADFVAPLREMRELYDADITVWMDTIAEGRFEDTNKMFEMPEDYDYRVTDWEDRWVKEIAERILSNSSFQQ